MTDAEFDAALVKAAFIQGAEDGWPRVTAASAALKAGLDLATARARFPRRGTILKKFGELADVHALTGAASEGETHDRLFDIVLRRFDFLQMHRAGVIALLKVVPLDPALGLWLIKANLASMGWMLEAAGVPAKGLRGELRKKGLGAVWAWGMRTWLRDETEDLSATMAAVDVALKRAAQVAGRFSIPNFAGDPAAAMPAAEPDAPFTAADEPPPVAL
jgi:hypothetical protein